MDGGLAIEWAGNKFSAFVARQSGGPPGWSATDAVRNVEAAFGTVPGKPEADMDLGGGGGGGGGGKTGKDPRDAIIEASVAAARFLHEKRLEDERWIGVQLKRAYNNKERDLKDFSDTSITLAEERYNAEIDLINAELVALQTSGKNEKEYHQRKLELDFEAVKALNKFNEEKGKIEDDYERERSAAQFASLARQVKWQEEADKRIIDRIRNDVENQAVERSIGEMVIAEVLAEGFARRKDLLEKEMEFFSTSAERREAITDDLISLEGERADAAVAASERIKAAIAGETAAKLGALAPGAGAQTPESGIGAQIKDMMGGEEAPLKSAITTIGEFRDAATSAWSSVTQGFGDMIYAFLMGEKLSGKAFMAMAKGAIAAVAAQAAVQALFELGMGLASLWWNPPKAALHFAAAKTFAMVAAVAGLASLAIPGGGAASANSPVAGNASKSIGKQEIKAIDENRRGAESGMNVNVNITRDAGSIVDAWVEDFGKNGRSRQIVTNGGQLATT